ncbi:MAG: heparan-alpha-glucosaminide N-acetyltransferase domain-containing protein [Chitinophagaceae bacterium]|nr:heparan-alpha-glucosaminide N-acetyltransferase domain-containing protein [Chitinophagaceae bacterium]
MTSPQRFLALDVFRGMTICLMIIVNTPGNDITFAPLLHAKWHGFTPTDLVFPSFLFAVGNAMSFVMPKWEGKSQSAILTKIFKRTALIFLLGYLMYWFPFFRLDENHHIISAPISNTRILGVLQRIALCYGIGSLMIYFLKPKKALYLSIVFLFLYWGLCIWFGDPFDPLSITGNAGLRLDLWLFGESHLYHGEGMAFDPEGLLSTLPAIANVIAGFTVGQFVQQKGKQYEGLAKLLLTGAGLLFLAYCWNMVFPVNKKLWTSSFVLTTVGLDCIILSAIIYLIDFKKKTGFTYFFEVMGKNPLFIYLLSEILVICFYITPIGGNMNLYSWLYITIFSHAGDYFGSLLFAVSYMLLCWSVGYILDKRKIYVRV